MAGGFLGGLTSFFNSPSALPQLSTQSALNDTAGQIGSLPGLNALTTAANNDTNSYFQNQINSLLPGFSSGVSSGLSTSLNNANSLLSGNIPSDVQSALQRSDAFKALSGGFGASSGMGQGLSARDLGLTSLNLMQQGQSMLQGDTSLGMQFGNFMTPGRLSPSQFLFNPQQMLGVQAQNNQVDYYNQNRTSPFAQFLGNIPGQALQTGLTAGLGMAGGNIGLPGLGTQSANSASGGAGFNAQYSNNYNYNPFKAYSSSASGGGFNLNTF